MKQSVNYPIQGAGALCFKLASIKLFNWLKENNLLFKVKYCVPAKSGATWTLEGSFTVPSAGGTVNLKTPYLMEN